LIVTQSSPEWIVVAWLVFESFSFFAYSIIMHGLRGQTLGKMVCKIRVLDVSESPLTMRQAVLRDILYIVFSCLQATYFLLNLDFYIQTETGSEVVPYPVWFWGLMYFAFVLFVIEMVTMLTNEKRRALHDWIAGSVVVRDA
jgi:uncharacterized RDD family membrane protein YckC